ncbi:MAG: hypothetical protein JST54_01065 [Deltaproteobacteria bacterium]|nr:hypothetical protein [Deltaproteobacteria bacterium]
MAIWVIRRAASGAREFLYHNVITQQFHLLGAVGDVPLVDLLLWVLDHGEPNIGDFIVVPGSRPLQLLPAEKE